MGCVYTLRGATHDIIAGATRRSGRHRIFCRMCAARATIEDVPPIPQAKAFSLLVQRAAGFGARTDSPVPRMVQYVENRYTKTESALANRCGRMTCSVSSPGNAKSCEQATAE